MRFGSIVGVGILLSACGGSSASSAPATPSTSASSGASATAASACVPAGWVPSEMIASVRPTTNPAGWHLTPNVLAWRTREDARPLVVESAIVRVEVKDADGGLHWVLLHVFRHPNERDGYANVWRRAEVADTPVTGVERYRAAPTRSEIERFMHDHDWDDSSGFRETGAGVCREAWPD